MFFEKSKKGMAGSDDVVKIIIWLGILGAVGFSVWKIVGNVMG